MSKSLSVSAVQNWFDETSQIQCECGASSFTVTETLYDKMMEDFGETVSPHQILFTCDNCNDETQNSLTFDVVEQIESKYE
jgi:hypothetical protein